LHSSSSHPMIKMRQLTLQQLVLLTRSNIDLSEKTRL
jgi:hypothetical protein